MRYLKISSVSFCFFSIFTVHQTGKGSITYIPTDEDWLYLAIMKDLCTKQIIAYAFSDRTDTNLILAALDMAVLRPIIIFPVNIHCNIM